MSIAALTTKFIPPTSCIASDNFWHVYSSSTSVSTSKEWGWWQLGPPPSYSDCYPPSFDPQSTAFYSPGQCPSGYTPAVQIVNTYAGSVTETTHTCCPTGARFNAQPTSNDIFSDWPVLRTLLCTSSFATDITAIATKTSAGTQAAGTAVMGLKGRSGRGGLNAYGIVVRFQSTDTQISSPTISSMLSTLTSAISSTTLPNTSRLTSTIEADSQLHTSGSETNSQPHTGGLGNGVKAGIGVGVAMGVLAALLIGAFIFLKRRKTMLGHGSVTTTQELDSVPVLEQKIQEAPGLPVHTSSQISELEAKPLR